MPARIRVLLVSSALYIGGAEQVVARLARSINRNEFEVAVCCLKSFGPIADELRRDGFEVLGPPKAKGQFGSYLTFLHLLSHIRRRNITIVHTHDTHGLADSFLAKLAVPGLKTVHTFHFGNYPHRYGRQRLMEGALWRSLDALVAVGHNQATRLGEFYRIPSRRLQVIWNGVPDASAIPGPVVNMPESTPTRPLIASVSTLIPQKGLHILLEAAALLRQSGDSYRMVIAGDGPLRNQLQEQISNLKIEDYVTLLGWVQEAGSRILPKCDIFVQSSLWEAMSVVVLEAMAAGRPAVVTNVGDNSRVVCNGQSGFLVPPGDANELASALRRLLRDSGSRVTMGNQARRLYKDTFTTERMVLAYEDLYRHMLNLTSSSQYGQCDARTKVEGCQSLVGGQDHQT